MKKSNQELLETEKGTANKNKMIGWNLEDGEREPQIPIHHPIQPGEKPSGAQAEQNRRTPWRKVNRITCVLGTPGKQKAAGKQHTKVSGLFSKPWLVSSKHEFEGLENLRLIREHENWNKLKKNMHSVSNLAEIK